MRVHAEVTESEGQLLGTPFKRYTIRLVDESGNEVDGIEAFRQGAVGIAVKLKMSVLDSGEGKGFPMFANIGEPDPVGGISLIDSEDPNHTVNLPENVFYHLYEVD